MWWKFTSRTVYQQLSLSVSRWTESYITSPQNIDKIKETLSLRFLGLRRSRRPLKQKKKRGYYSAILTEKAWSIRVYHITKYFALVRIKTELFISWASKESRMYFGTPNQQEDFMFSLFWLSPSVFWRVNHRRCPRITIRVSPLGLVHL